MHTSRSLLPHRRHKDEPFAAGNIFFLFAWCRAAAAAFAYAMYESVFALGHCHTRQNSLVTMSAHEPIAPPADTEFLEDEEEGPPHGLGFVGGCPATTLAAAAAAAAAAATEERRGEGQERAGPRVSPGAGRLAAITGGGDASSSSSPPDEEGPESPPPPPRV